MTNNNPLPMDLSKDSNLLATKRDIKFLLQDKQLNLQYEPAVVLDIILDNEHSEIIKKGHNIDTDQWPENYIGEKPNINDIDYTWIGRAKVRLLNSHTHSPKEVLPWIMPLEIGTSEYPLVNEIVGVIEYEGTLYYTRKINYKNFINNNADIGFELTYGGGMGNREQISDNMDPEFVDYKGPISKLTYKGGYGFEGSLGRYFLQNSNIRSLRRFEGDTVFESRFGQSIRFGAYDDNRENDKGYSDVPDENFSGYNDYNIGKRNKNTFYKGKFLVGGGNPMMLFRNRQRPLKKNIDIQLHPRLPIIQKIDKDDDRNPEKNVGGYLLEDINNDGTSIHITSGCTISKFVTTCYKRMFGVNGNNTGEEVDAFSPPNVTDFTYPILNKDQLILNTDRIILSSRFAETFHFSKKRYAIVTDSEYTLDAHDQVVITTHKKAVINAPVIFLGEYDQTGEPALLGQTTVDWLFDLCEWLKTHVHWYIHSHPNAGGSNPNITQVPVQLTDLQDLENRLDVLMSRRVFLTGGGYAPGQNGVQITDGSQPTVINTITGEGVPGEFNGADRRGRRESGELNTNSST